mmetsp:Transcript_6677/g.12551  ORF Transcript_6677/g.12551 Transcript_6677/m.12551 type:complete len:263 (+) Transcript_6677:1902-2690(+)
MDVYTAVPLISSSAASNAPRSMERIQSRAARSLLKVLLFVITLLAILSVIIIHALPKHNSSKTVHSFEEILGEKEALPTAATSRFAEEQTSDKMTIPTPAAAQERPLALDSSPRGGLRGFANGPVVHRVILVRPVQVMDVNSLHQQITSEIERDVMQVFNAMEREMEETMTSFFGPFSGFHSFSSFDDFFKGPLSGFEEIHRPCPMMRGVLSTSPSTILPLAGLGQPQVAVKEEPVVAGSNGKNEALARVSNGGMEETSQIL